MTVRRLLAALALVVAVTPVGADPAAAVTNRGKPGYCPDTNGVTVIIDFQDLGGTTIVRCAPGDQATGLAALKNAGIEIAGTARWGEAFICRIEGRPGPDREPCIDTPPASAYWSYWHSPNGGNWTYSQWGVKNRKPPPGSFEGWSFSFNRTADTNPPPRIKPARPAASPPGGNPTGNAPPGGGNPGAPAPGPGGTPPAASPSGTTGPTVAPTSPAGPGTAPPSAAPSDPAATDWTGGEDVATTTGRDAGFPWATILGGVLVVGLVVCSAAMVRSRRKAADTGDGAG